MPDLAVVRPAMRDDLVVFYGKVPERTMKAMVAEYEGRILGVFGVKYCGQGKPQIMFSDIREGEPRNPSLIVRAARTMLERYAGGPVQAVADPKEPTAPKFLTYLGFEHVGSSQHGEVYRYDPRRVR